MRLDSIQTHEQIGFNELDMMSSENQFALFGIVL
jgi:hypothetical protein